MERSSVLELETRRARDIGKGKLLLVDEDLGDLQVYSNMLTQLGYEVRAFGCYREAEICVGREAFDLVIVSQGSSDFEGRTVIARTTEIDRRIPVVVLTHVFEIPCYAEAIQLGALDYLPKPLPAWELERLVSGCLRSRTGSA